MKKNESDYLSDYAEFNRSENKEAPPAALSFKIRDKIKADLQPSMATVFGKLVSLHVIAGAVTLLVCPQYGLGPLGGGAGILSSIEQYGHVVCGLFCGSFFVSLTTFLSWVFLRKEIQKVLNQNQLLNYPILGLLSFIALATFSFMVNGELPHLHAQFIMAWLIGFSVFPILLNRARALYL